MAEKARMPKAKDKGGVSNEHPGEFIGSGSRESAGFTRANDSNRAGASGPGGLNHGPSFPGLTNSGEGASFARKGSTKGGAVKTSQKSMGDEGGVKRASAAKAKAPKV